MKKSKTIEAILLPKVKGKDLYRYDNNTFIEGKAVRKMVKDWKRNMNDREQIENEDWRKAEGIIPEDTINSALATRDYSVECNIPYKITAICGYFIWWCSTHHQPHSKCLDEKMRRVHLNHELDAQQWFKEQLEGILEQVKEKKETLEDFLK